MSGYSHQQVHLDATVDVAPTPTLLASLDVRKFASLALELRNADPAQTLATYAEASWDGLSNWAALPAITSTQLGDIGPGETRWAAFDCADLRYVRVMGIASGAGLSCGVRAQTVVSLSTGFYP